MPNDSVPEWYLRPPSGKHHDYTVHAKQRDVLRSDARYKTLKWGRRAGKNGTATIEVLEFCRDPSSKPWGRDNPLETPDDAPIEVWWVSRSYDQAKKHGFEKLKAAAWDVWIADQSRSEPYSITFENGVRVEFRTFDHPDTLQGAGVDGIVVDERDYMPDSVWNNDLDPMTLDYSAWVLWISKPVRPNSLFQQWYDRGQSSEYPDFYSSHATSADNPFIDEDPGDRRDTVPEHVFRQQYLAELPDDGGQVFSQLSERLFTADYALEGMIDDEGCGALDRPIKPHTPMGRVSVAVDFARHRDYRVTIALREDGTLLHYSRQQNEAWDTIEADIREQAGKWTKADVLVVPDATRDNKIIADLDGEGVPLHPMDFAPKRKKALIEDLATRIENRELSLPDDPRLDRVGLELRQLERTVSDAGYTRYHAPENGYDDVVDALAMAAAGLELAPVNREDKLSSLPYA